MSGGSGAFSQIKSQLPAQETQSGGAEYAPAQTQPTYQQAQPSRQVSPINQQMAARQNFQNMGLQALYQGMMSNFQQPAQQQAPQQMPGMGFRAPTQQAPQMPSFQQQAQQYNPMPQYGQQRGTNPLAYRPDMTQAMANLSNVKPSVFKSQLDEANARIAEYEAEAAARTQAEQDPYSNMG